MAAKTLHELEIEIEKLKVELAIVRRDLDLIMNIHKKEIIIDPVKSSADAGENTK